MRYYNSRATAERRREKKEKTNNALNYVLETFQLPPDIEKALKNAIVGERGPSENTLLLREYDKLVKENIKQIMSTCPKEGYTAEEIANKISFPVSISKVSSYMTAHSSYNPYNSPFIAKEDYKVKYKKLPKTYTLPNGKTCTKMRKYEIAIYTLA